MMLRAILLLGAALQIVLAGPGNAEQITVVNGEQLKAAIAKAAPGDIIMMTPGRYDIDRIAVTGAGTPERPILLTAAALGEVKLIPSGTEAFKITAPYWIFENLDIGGGPLTEHAFHIAGAASHVIVRHNFLHDLNAMIKGNGEGTPAVFPNDVLIEDNILIDEAPRIGDAPVTPIDVVGGQRWVLRGNFIADFAKTGGNHVSYGAFLKGNSSDGIIEHNLIVCEWKTHGGVRIGLSLGGGGTEPGLCDQGSCDTEHRNGIIRSNIIANCPQDVGIYLNKASGTKILNNTLYDTNGIDVRFPVSSARVDGNIVSGGIRQRDGGTAAVGDNRIFANAAGSIGHKGLAWLEEKILGAAKTHPDALNNDQAHWLAGNGGPVDQADRLIGTTFLGGDRSGLDALFENARQGNFALNPLAENVKTSPSPDVIDDFCNLRRDAGHPSIGAIEVLDDGCYPPMVMLRAESLIIRDRQW